MGYSSPNPTTEPSSRNKNLSKLAIYRMPEEWVKISKALSGYSYVYQNLDPGILKIYEEFIEEIQVKLKKREKK